MTDLLEQYVSGDYSLDAPVRLRRKGDVDVAIAELPLERRLAATCRRAADVFYDANMLATYALLRELADALDAEARYAAEFLEGDDE